MFPRRYYADRYFAPRYFPKVGATPAASAGSGGMLLLGAGAVLWGFVRLLYVIQTR